MITFNNQNIKFTLKNRSLLKQWIQNIVEKKKCKAGEISFIFCSDEALLEINQQYLKHNTYTDIITFDYSKEKKNSHTPLLMGEFISGDIFISIDRVGENAKKFSKSFENELHRVMIHGVLHLLGFTDKTKTTKAEMTKEEDICLKKLRKQEIK